jgi:hypothetical protein
MAPFAQRHQSPVTSIHLEILASSICVVGVTDLDDSGDAQKRPQQLFHQRKEWWLPAMAKHSPDAPRKVMIVQIRIDRMTGRRSRRSDIAEGV